MSRYQPYPKYKDSGVEWLGEVPEHWLTASLKFISNITLGKMLTSSDKGNMSYKPYLKAKNIRWISVDTNNIDYMWFSPDELLKLRLKKNDLLVSEGGEVGRTALWRNEIEECYIQNSVNRVRINHHEPRYFLYQFYAAAHYGYFNAIVNKISIAHLTKEKLGDVKFLVVSLLEQTTIANFLDRETAKIDTLIEKQQRLIELLKEKRQALISHAVTKGLDPNVKMKDSGVEWLGEVPEHWEISKLRYIFSFTKGLTITKADLKETGIPCVSYGEIHSKYGFEVPAEKNDLKCVDPQYLKTSRASLLSKGDFVFVDTSEDLEGAGNFTHLSGDTNIFAGYHTIIARQDKNNSYRFLAYLMDSTEFRTQIRLSVRGVKVFSITQAILRDAIVWLPSIDEQQNIANYLDTQTKKIDTLVKKANQAITLLKERRTALISAAVTGKIDVRELGENHE